MAERLIADPILNGPYDEPGRHFEFGDDGITDTVLDRRRPSSYFVPVPRARKGARQLALPELSVDQIKVNGQVNLVRERVALWRRDEYAGASHVSRQLLDHWADAERDNRILFCQREAAETAIYLAEVAQQAGQGWIANELAGLNAEHNDGMPRVALKMATGAGKTVVMAMLIAWQTLNRVRQPMCRGYTKRFPWSRPASRSATGCGCCCRSHPTTTTASATSYRSTCRATCSRRASRSRTTTR